MLAIRIKTVTCPIHKFLTYCFSNIVRHHHPAINPVGSFAIVDSLKVSNDLCFGWFMEGDGLEVKISACRPLYLNERGGLFDLISVDRSKWVSGHVLRHPDGQRGRYCVGSHVERCLSDKMSDGMCSLQFEAVYNDIKRIA